MLNKFQTSWTLVYWDMPMDTQAARKSAQAVRRAVRRCGARHWGTAANGAALILGGIEAVREKIGPVPADGEMRFVPLTDAQMSHTQVVWGRRRTMAEAR